MTERRTRRLISGIFPLLLSWRCCESFLINSRCQERSIPCTRETTVVQSVHNQIERTILNETEVDPSIVSEAAREDDRVGEEQQQEEDDDESCVVPQEKAIILISDATGVMAKSALQKCLNQFDSCDDQYFTIAGSSQQCKLSSKLFTFVRTEEAIAALVKQAQEEEALIIFTLASPEMREKTRTMCELSKVTYVDLMGGIFDIMSSFFEQTPRGTIEADPRKKKRTALSDSYFRRIDAVEFTLKADDGQAPWLLADADVVLVGCSRTGKTPLSVLLSQTMNLRVANVPIVFEVPPPRELLRVDPNRIVCLTSSPAALSKVRSNRLEATNVASLERTKTIVSASKSNYADKKYLIQELMNAKRLADQYGWTEIDVSGRAVEETASLVAEIMGQRFPEMNFL